MQKELLMAGSINLYGQIDFEPLINTAYAAILIQAIQESVRAAEIAKLEGKRARLETTIKSYQESLERNHERKECSLKDMAAAQKRIDEGTITKRTHSNLKQAQENLSKATKRIDELNTKLANAEENLAKANKHIETLRAKNALTTTRETQNLHYIFFPQASMPQKNKISTYSRGITKGY